MKTSFRKTWLCSFLLCCTFTGLSLVLVYGCGKLDTGAFAEPSVKIKLAESASAGPGEPKPGTATDGASSGGPGTFAGRVVFKGAPPSPKPFYSKGGAPKNPEICSALGEIVNEELLVSSDGGIANVFVYLEKAPAGFKDTPPKEPVLFDQKNCVFTTHAMIVRVGQTMKVLSDDALVHNTHTHPNKNDEENMIVKANEREGIPLVFKKAEKFPFGVNCDYHAWMSAYQLPLDHPFGAVTDKNGNFKIENLPAGSYQFKLWHEKADSGKGGGYLDTKYKAVVKPGDNDAVTIDVVPSKFGL